MAMSIKELEESANKYEGTLSWTIVLGFLTAHQGYAYDIKELSDKCGLKKATTTAGLHVLLKQGKVQRKNIGILSYWYVTPSEEKAWHY